MKRITLTYQLGDEVMYFNNKFNTISSVVERIHINKQYEVYYILENGEKIIQEDLYQI
tara:strand:- start:461 stop:634 length:174 start_codon:yes stop_codon:yes gene_type:complete